MKLSNESVHTPSDLVDPALDQNGGSGRSENTEWEEWQGSRQSASGQSSHAFEDAITTPQELSLFRSFRPKDTTANPEYWEAESPSGRYRAYIGVVLAAVIVALAYMAWRSSQNSSQLSHEASPPPPPAANAHATAPATPMTAAQPDSASNAAPEKSADSAEMLSTHEPANLLEASQTAAASTEGTSEPLAADNGSQELAMAQRYLQAGNGRAVDGTEAAQWLWKSVAKHNAEATLLLADLYLRGDGVSKNCDQARVLLDAAASKGVKGAGERLRHLQAFGCQ